MQLGPIIGFDNLARDLETGAVINLDNNTLRITGLISIILGLILYWVITYQQL